MTSVVPGAATETGARVGTREGIPEVTEGVGSDVGSTVGWGVGAPIVADIGDGVISSLSSSGWRTVVVDGTAVGALSVAVVGKDVGTTLGGMVVGLCVGRDVEESFPPQFHCSSGASDISHPVSRIQSKW